MNTIRHLLLLPVLFFTFETSAQSTIANAGNHVLYEGVPNPIVILIDGIAMRDLVITADNGIITGSQGEYNVEVKVGPQRTCLIKAGKLISRSDTLWLHKQEFMIRPTPYLSPSVNGKEGGYITKEEMEAWNFLDVSFGLEFPGIEYDIVVSSKKYLKQFHKFNQEINDTLKDAFVELVKDDKIGFINISFTDPQTKRTREIPDLWFTVSNGGIEQTIYNKYTKKADSLKNFEYFSGAGYKYSGKKAGSKKDGLWTTYESGCCGVKIAETLYRMDSIIEEKQYYCNGILMSKTKYNAADTSAYLITYFPNGAKCYEGSYKVNPSLDFHISGFDGTENKDYFLNDTAAVPSDQTYTNSKIPPKMVFGEWKFYYKDGKPAAKGNFNYVLESSPIDEENNSYFYTVARVGTWQYFHPTGYVFHKSSYDNGKTVVESFYNSKGQVIK